MKKLTAAVVTILMSSPVAAFPLLQLDIVSDTTTYDNVTETVTTNSETFDVYAYGNRKHGSGSIRINVDYYLSISIIGTPSAFGSFTIDGDTIELSDTVFGNPFGTSNSHGIFDANYYEQVFMFDSSLKRHHVNTDISPGTDPLTNIGNDFLYMAFDIDTSGLNDGVGLHFDLYDKNDSDLGDKFAQFNYDAQFIDVSDTNTTEVPAPIPMVLIGIGLLGLLRKFR